MAIRLFIQSLGQTWKSRRILWNSFSLGGPEGNQTVLRDLPWETVSIQTQGFSTVCQTLGFKGRCGADEGLPEKNTEGRFRLSLGTV